MSFSGSALVAVRNPAERPAWTDVVRNLVEKAGPSDVPVLIQGETGSGKEVVAKRIHAASPRARGPFLKLNCAALPSELVESELFGYERGAFTGAFRSAPGKFELADGGTIFLDEIGEMDFRLQAKLLQVLQDGEFFPLGGTCLRTADVRVIAATHCDLHKAIADGQFREDLYYRLDVVRIEVPPLRERKCEILPLAQHFLDKHAKSRFEIPPIPPHLAAALVEHPWPGNVRELENAMRRYLVFDDPAEVILHLRSRVNPSATSTKPAAGPVPVAKQRQPETPTMEEIHRQQEAAERRTILDVLESVRWNRKKAAAMLALDYKALLYRMKRLGIAADRDAAD